MSDPFVKLSCAALTDAKLLSAGPDGFTLWVRGLLYAKIHLTDGFVPRCALRLFGVKRSETTAAKLVALGLWVEADDGYTVGLEKWARYQPTRESIERKRYSWKKTKAKQRSLVNKGGEESVHIGVLDVSNECPRWTDLKEKEEEEKEEKKESTKERKEEKEEEEKENTPSPQRGGSSEASPKTGKPRRTVAEVEPSVEALEVATRWAKLVSRNLGPTFQQSTIRKFAVAVFGPMLSEFGRGSIETVFAYLATPRATEDWRYGLLNAPKGYEHPFKRNFGGLLGKAQRSGFTPKSNEPAKPLRLAPLRHLEPSPEPEPMGDGTEVEEC